MATYTYRQLRKVLRALGFGCVRNRKHETRERVLTDGTLLQVRVSHKGKRDIPRTLFYEMLRQAGINEDTFRQHL